MCPIISPILKYLRPNTYHLYIFTSFLVIYTSRYLYISVPIYPYTHLLIYQFSTVSVIWSPPPSRFSSTSYSASPVTINPENRSLWQRIQWYDPPKEGICEIQMGTSYWDELLVATWESIRGIHIPVRLGTYSSGGPPPSDRIPKQRKNYPQSRLCGGRFSGRSPIPPHSSLSSL